MIKEAFIKEIYKNFVKIVQKSIGSINRKQNTK